MKQYVCTICNYIYAEDAGIPQAGIVPGTKWDDVPENWVCPICGAIKADFKVQQQGKQTTLQQPHVEENNEEDLREMSFAELSALCSNLSKGCEKQYRAEEADLFHQLAEYYQSKGGSVDTNQMNDLTALVEQDLNTWYPEANIVAADRKDRGALRALLWGEKVTRMLNSLLSRYEKEKDALLKNTNVFVCEICGFLYIGEEAPEICPVCKVPRMKITKVERG